MEATNPKKTAAQKAAAAIEEGMIVGLGTGSTATYAIEAIGEKVEAGLPIKAVASSIKSENLARQLGIEIISFENINVIDLTIDGADEVDSRFNLIKGGGGSLLREKILAYNSKRLIIIVDESKVVDTLGKFSLPVEIVQFAAPLTLHKLKALQCEPRIRMKEGKAFVTDNGNWIADCSFQKILHPEELTTTINMIPGVVENGIFLHTKVSSVMVGNLDGSVGELRANAV